MLIIFVLLGLFGIVIYDLTKIKKISAIFFQSNRVNRALTPSSGSSNLSTPAKQKEQASACSFCFTCEAVKERFELRATPPGEKTVLRTVFSDDRRYLQSIGLNFRICFANIKRKISLPQPNKKNRLLPVLFILLAKRLKRDLN